MTVISQNTTTETGTRLSKFHSMSFKRLNLDKSLLLASIHDLQSTLAEPLEQGRLHSVYISCINYFFGIQIMPLFTVTGMSIPVVSSTTESVHISILRLFNCLVMDCYYSFSPPNLLMQFGLFLMVPQPFQLERRLQG